MKMMQRTLNECKKRGWIYHNVEKWNQYSKRKTDLFSIIDVVAIDPTTGVLYGIQSCSNASGGGADVLLHIRKILATPETKIWLSKEYRFRHLLLFAWGKKSPRDKNGKILKGKRQTWQLREVFLEMNSRGSLTTTEIK